VTDAGARELTDWLTELIAAPTKEYPHFMAGLSFLPALGTDDALEALRQRAVALEIRLAQIRAGLRAAADVGLPRLFELEGEYEEHLMETELDFVRSLIKEIDDGSLDGIELWRSFHTGSYTTPPALAPRGIEPQESTGIAPEE
jgi:hypothetical protein